MLLSTLLTALTAQNARDASERAFIRGLNEYRTGDLEPARDSFEACLQHDRSRTDCMTNLGSVLIDIGGEQNDALAEQMYRTVLEADPAHSDAAFNLALQLQDRKTDVALREASTLYLEVVAADPQRWDAWANLGTSLAEVRDRPLQAARAFQRAIVELERSHDEAVSESKPIEEELSYLAELYYNYGLQLAALDRKLCAAYAAEPTSLLIGVEPGGDVDGKVDLVCLENAQNALRTTLQLDPTHVRAEHMLASMLADANDGIADVSKASPAFVKALFDDFSNTFDEKLASLGCAGVPESTCAAFSLRPDGRRSIPSHRETGRWPLRSHGCSRIPTFWQMWCRVCWARRPPSTCSPHGAAHPSRQRSMRDAAPASPARTCDHSFLATSRASTSRKRCSTRPRCSPATTARPSTTRWVSRRRCRPRPVVCCRRCRRSRHAGACPHP